MSGTGRCCGSSLCRSAKSDDADHPLGRVDNRLAGRLTALLTPSSSRAKEDHNQSGGEAQDAGCGSGCHDPRLRRARVIVAKAFVHTNASAAS
jgi:hypothetical protein